MSVDADFAWAGQPVEVNQIEETLRNAWREEAARAPEASGSLAMRTNVLNLIVQTMNPEGIRQVKAAIEHLGTRHPSRAIIVLAEPDKEEATLQSYVKHNTQTIGDRRLVFEQVTVVASGEAAKHLPAVVDALLVPELPDFLWWMEQPPFMESRFTRVLDIVDRLIIDSASFVDISGSLKELAEMSIIPHGAAISDFAWERLRRWRELVAQFFDPVDYAPLLGMIETVTIGYEPAGGNRYSGFTEGLLALGWLASRLGWQIEHRPEREADGAYRWVLRAGERSVTVALRPDHYGDNIVGLRTMHLTVSGKEAGTFKIYRENGAHIAAQIDVPGLPNLNQMIRVTERDENDLLLQALDQFGADPTYEGALVFAAQLANGVERLQ